MKNTSISMFRQILDLVPKHEFEKIIMKHNGDKHKQTFDCWAHFVSMIFCQLAQANSLRERRLENLQRQVESSWSRVRSNKIQLVVRQCPSLSGNIR